MSPDALHNLRDAARYLLQCEPEASVEAQQFYQAIHAWALRGMGYGLGDHPSTSGERGVLEMLKGRLPLSVTPIVFDVGANVGDYAMLAADVLGFGMSLHCFEPSTSAFAELRRRIGPQTHDTFAHPFGLSDASRTAPLHTDALGSGMASVHPRRLAHFGRALAVEERATFRRLDDVCRELGVSRIDLLKLDVEGHELAVLRGTGDMLTSGAIGMIQWEMGGCNLDSRTTFQDLWYALHERYDIARVVVDGLVPMPRYREQDEVYVCSNFVAVWRA